MKPFVVKPVPLLKGEISLLGDKSIAHRAVIVSAITKGKTIIENFPANDDCLSTIRAFKKLGVKIIEKYKNKTSSVVTVFGKGLYGLKKPIGPIFIGESGTTLRLLTGLLAGQDFSVRLTTAKSLSLRPMLRVTAPLRLMGADIKSTHSTRLEAEYQKIEEYPPLEIKGSSSLKPIAYTMPVASAQVKSALLFAGLYSKGMTSIIESIRTRDHTERMLKLFKAGIKVKGNKVVIKGGRELISPKRIYVPGDISSAGFFIILAAILPEAKLLLKNVCLNHSRIGLVNVLVRMGADVKIKYQKSKIKYQEPVGDLIVRSSALKGARIKSKEAPSLIDELPILMVAASVARGRTVFEGIEELRVKETDRIKSMSENLAKMGANIEVFRKGDSERMVIKGVKRLKGSKVKSFGDHRTAMSMIIAGLRAEGRTCIDDVSCISKSFPNFLVLLKRLLP